MNNLIKTLVIGLFLFGLANCGSDGGGGGGGGSTPEAGLAGNADSITIDDGQSGGPVQWSSNYANIYNNVSPNGNCVDGLAQSADDATLEVALTEMRELLNAASVQSGTGEGFAFASSSMPTLTIGSGSDSEVYYLVDREDIPSDAKTLSNASAILDFYDQVLNELNNNGYYYCPGKGHTLPGNSND